MIKLLRSGDYRLIETRHLTKILFLDQRGIYAWVNAEGIGEILVTSHKQHIADYILALGKYRLYKVIEEPSITNTWHLELSVGIGCWQGYLLPTGLPNNIKKRNEQKLLLRSRIIPTDEVITRVRSSMLPSLAAE